MSLKIYKRVAIVVAALNILSLSSAPCLSEAVVTDSNIITDIIVGHNNKGPYPLSWTDVDTNSMDVIVSGRTLRSGNDYKVDVSKGIIAFDSILANDAIVRVSYKIIPGKSKRSTGQSIPVTLNLFQRQDSSMQVTGLFTQDGTNSSDPGKTIVGLGGDKKWETGKINSMFYVSQSNDSNGSSDSAGSWDRSAMKFGGDTNLGSLKLTGSFLHAGTDFGGSKEYGMELGKQTTDLAATFAPAGNVQANAKFQQIEQNSGANAGNYSLVNEQNLVFTPGKTTKLSFGHSLKENGTAAAGSDTSTDLTSLGFEQKFGGNTTASASLENANQTVGNTEDQIQTQKLQLTSSPYKNMSFNGIVSQRFSELHGSDQAMNFGVSAKPTDKMNVNLAFGTDNNDESGSSNVTEVKVAATPTKQLGVQAAYKDANSDVQGQVTNTEVKVTASPIQQMAVQASYSGTDSETQGTNTKTNITLQAKPMQNMQIKGSVSDNVQNQDEQYQRDFSLSSTPAKYAKMTAIFSQKGVNDQDNVTKGANLELTPLSNLQLSAGYHMIEDGQRILTITDYATATKPWRFLSISGSYRDRELRQDDIVDTAAVQVALSPLNYFTFTGDYQLNPEDKAGAIQNYQASTMGLTTKLGSVGLTGKYTSRDEYLSSRFTDERQINLSMKAFGNGQFSTGFKLGRQFDGSDLSNRTYLLGYSRSIGSDFSLSLTGYYTQYLQNQMMMPDKDEYSAEASLGLKF